MPEATEPMGGASPPMGGSPQQAQQAQQAPMGVSSVTGPTPNKGYEAQVLQQLGHVSNLLFNMMPMVGFNSPLGKSIGKLLDDIKKVLPAGNQDQQAQRNAIQSSMNRFNQQAQMVQSLKQPTPESTSRMPGGPPMPPRMAGMNA